MAANEHVDGEKERSWHLTDDPRFALDPEKRPFDNFTLDGPHPEPGLYVAEGKGLETWFNGYDYVRPFAAEIEHPLLEEGFWGLCQSFLPATLFAESELLRVIPIDEWVREKFEAPGWIEVFHDDAPAEIRLGYRYTGLDVRDMARSDVLKLVARIDAYIGVVRPWIHTGEQCPVVLTTQMREIQA